MGLIYERCIYAVLKKKYSNFNNNNDVDEDSISKAKYVKLK